MRPPRITELLLSFCRLERVWRSLERRLLTFGDIICPRKPRRVSAGTSPIRIIRSHLDAGLVELRLFYADEVDLQVAQHAAYLAHGGFIDHAFELADNKCRTVDSDLCFVQFLLDLPGAWISDHSQRGPGPLVED